MLQTISKKNNKKVMLLLSKHSKLHFGALKRALKIDGRLITTALNELLSEGLIMKEYEDPTKRTAKVYYSLTPLGREALKIYELAEELERKKEAEINENSGVVISGNVSGENIIIGNNNSTIHIKKQ